MIFLKGSIIVSLKQAFEAGHFLEKLIWICLGSLGSVYFGYLLVSQVNSWDEKFLLISKLQKSIEEIEFPTITFCNQKSTKYAISERIGNALDMNSEFSRKKLLPVRNELVRLLAQLSLKHGNGNISYNLQCDEHRWNYEQKSQHDIERFCTVRLRQVFFKALFPTQT